MTLTTNLSLLVIITFILAGSAYAGPADTAHSITLPSVETVLKAGEGRDKTASLCSICHSPDYITMQPPFSRAQWTAVVNKMIKVMGAPINKEDEKTIVNYLTVNYGKGD